MFCRIQLRLPLRKSLSIGQGGGRERGESEVSRLRNSVTAVFIRFPSPSRAGSSLSRTRKKPSLFFNAIHRDFQTFSSTGNASRIGRERRNADRFDRFTNRSANEPTFSSSARDALQNFCATLRENRAIAIIPCPQLAQFSDTASSRGSFENVGSKIPWI